MRYIDAFNHFFPKRAWEMLLDFEGRQGRDGGKRFRSIACVHDLEARMRLVESFHRYHYSQILSLPPFRASGDANMELTRAGNDGLCELIDRHPDHFPGFVATLPMDTPEEAAREAERVFTELGANGIQIHSNVNGVPLDDERFLPIFEIAAKHDKMILLHPTRGAAMADYPVEDKSRYEIWWAFGWPYETSVAMARMVFSGLFDRLPGLKVMAHHLGGVVPYLEQRISHGYAEFGSRTSDEDYGVLLRTMKKKPIDYFKGFYADSVTFGSRAATICGLDFYGVDHVLFASDCPFDPEGGAGYVRDTIALLEGLDLPGQDLERIAHRNAERLFGLRQPRTIAGIEDDATLA